jgi:hypothetical protein
MTQDSQLCQPIDRWVRGTLTTRSDKDNQQQVLALGWDEVQEDAQLWEYTVLVTDVAYELSAIGQLYRDRCDCENALMS